MSNELLHDMIDFIERKEWDAFDVYHRIQTYPFETHVRYDGVVVHSETGIPAKQYKETAE